MGNLKCKECRQELYEYRDNTLSAGRVSLLRAHLENCPSCRVFYLQEMELSQTFREMADSLEERLHGQFQPTIPQNRKPAPAPHRLAMPMVRWAAATAIVVILAVSVKIFIFQGSKPATDPMARMARSSVQSGTQPPAGNVSGNERDVIQVITMEDDSGQLNETHFRQEKDGMVCEITVEVTAVRLAEPFKG